MYLIRYELGIPQTTDEDDFNHQKDRSKEVDLKTSDCMNVKRCDQACFFYVPNAFDPLQSL